MVSTNPLMEPPPKEVPLKKAPLIRVIAQVCFPLITSIENKSFIGRFQEAIRDKYPFLQPDQTESFVLASQGLIRTDQVTWRFVNAEGNWRVSLAPEFIALETTDYISRSDFLARLKDILTPLNEHIKPNIVQRFGMRYINRLVGQSVKDISKLVVPEIAGVTALDFTQSMTEYWVTMPEREDLIIARWGLVPPNKTFDPNAIEPVSEHSWILDLDMSLTKQREFNVDALIIEGQGFAQKIYTLFRWAVTDDFLVYFGGEQ